ncbi:MAG: hypothetical protein FJ137_20545 [Deltaproteobacteria bacterium]|nr:hypothetical protein [Deltaproteobacteria bacterium]
MPAATLIATSTPSNGCSPPVGCLQCDADGDCGDGNSCTLDVCDAGACRNPPRSCPFGCNATTGACFECGVDGDCDDSNPCTTNRCDAGSCSFPDETGCAFGCDAATGSCFDCATDARCEDIR